MPTRVIVDDGADDTKRKRQLYSVPSCTEKRRKLCVKDYMCDEGLDWDQARELHRSIFSSLKIDIPDKHFTSIVSSTLTSRRTTLAMRVLMCWR